jgi:inosine/xanthosine triphosphatase
MRVVVGSRNPVKINAVKEGFERMFPEHKFVFEGLAVPSNVPDQPMGDNETYIGAENRAKNARNILPEADYWVGLEGGLVETSPTEIEAMAWIVILDKNSIGKSRTASFNLPPATIKLIKEGFELGHADEKIHNVINSKQNNGTTGLLTNNVLTRLDYYIQSVILALIPFKNVALFNPNNSL